MLQLHEDKNFHYEAIRALAMTRFHGGDIAEILTILPTIKAGDFDSWFEAWDGLARRVLSTIDESKLKSYSPVTLREVYFRASRYFFTADFFLHGEPTDPRIGRCYELWTEYFKKANALLPIPGWYATVKAQDGSFDIPVIVYRAAEASAANPRPTLIAGGGFDSNIEELYHAFVVPALERGYNVVIYEGPGQPTLIHKQNKGFIFDWERVVTPVVDYVSSDPELSFIDLSKLGLIGYSLGGYLAARAAAFEPRLAAVICIDGVWSMTDACAEVFPEVARAWDAGDMKTLTDEFEKVSPRSSTNARWFHDHLKFSFCTTSIEEVYGRLAKMNLDGGVAQQIKMPAFIGEAEEDIFFLGQPARVAGAIGSNATLVKFTSDQAAGAHCQSGALVYLNQELLEWFAGVIGEKNL